jgi:hypothetical protein
MTEALAVVLGLALGFFACCHMGYRIGLRQGREDGDSDVRALVASLAGAVEDASDARRRRASREAP